MTPLANLLSVAGVLILLVTSGCATSLERSKSTVTPQHDFATATNNTSGPLNADLTWIIGTWESSSLSFGDFGEWRGASKLQIHAIATNDMDLVLVYPTGQRRIAFDSWPCRMTEDSLYFGPLGSALRFYYRREKNVLHLRLDSSNTIIVAKLERTGPPPPESERLPGRYIRHKDWPD